MFADQQLFIILGIVTFFLLAAVVVWRWKQSRPQFKPSAQPKQPRQPEQLGGEQPLPLPRLPDLSPVDMSEKIQPLTAEPTEPAVEAPKEKQLEQALSKTRWQIVGRIKNLFASGEKISAEDLERIEEILFTSDIGPQTVQKLMDKIETERKGGGLNDFSSLANVLKLAMNDIFSSVPGRALASGPPPVILMIVGVNGAGKTTTIGKLANQLAQANKKVLIAAGDTFRAAAREQLRIWSDRAQVEIFDMPETKDPSAIAYGACERGKQKQFDYVIIDTAGRLHTQKNLMEELKKMKRVMQKVIPEAPHEILLILDANNGQNALMQAREFHAALDVTGVILTKMDGTAKGGVAVGVASELRIPIQWIGVGEKVSDLRPFSAADFVNSIF